MSELTNEQINESIDESNKIRFQYTYSYLMYFINRDNAQLIGEYTNLTSKTKITFICKCKAKTTKQFSSIEFNYGINGAQCRNCGVIRHRLIKSGGYVLNTKITYPILENPASKYKNEIVNNNNKNNKALIKKKKERFDFDLLMIYIKRDEAILIGEYNLLKRDSMITYKCNCGNICTRQFVNIVRHDGIVGLICNFCANLDKSDCIKVSLQKHNPDKTLDEIYKEINIKASNTLFENRGVYHNSQIESVKEQKKETCIKNFGVDHQMKSPIILEQIKTTNLIKYGTENSMQNKEVHAKKVANSKNKKEYKSPSGIVHILESSCEIRAMEELHTIYQDNDIQTGKNAPVIKYNNKYYFPDIYIKSINKIIEVKSEYTYKSFLKETYDKAKACIDAGYDFDLWIYIDKSDKKEIITKDNIYKILDKYDELSKKYPMF